MHGPEDAERDADGFVNCEVIGFILSGPDLPVIYVSGDNASIGTVAEIARRTPSIDAVVLHAGAARVPARFRNRAEPGQRPGGRRGRDPGGRDHPGPLRRLDPLQRRTRRPRPRLRRRRPSRRLGPRTAHGQVTGNGGCHHQGVVWSSMRSTHFTHQYPRRRVLPGRRCSPGSPASRHRTPKARPAPSWYRPEPSTTVSRH